MGIRLNDQAFEDASKDMEALLTRTQTLKENLEQMYHSMTTALDTPAGHEIEFVGLEDLVKPIEDMILVVDHMSKTLNIIIGKGGTKGVYYDKLFEEYEELERTLINKVQH